jgi:hypothetical protein
MNNQEFNCTITVNITPKEAVRMISRVSDWWVKDVDGKTVKLNDEFTVHFGATWVTFRITEVTEEKTIVWSVSDCNLPWNSNLKEWNGTRIVWEISSIKDSTKIDFSHIGLVQLDCANQCMNSWGGYIKQSLFKLITEGKGLPNKF